MQRYQREGLSWTVKIQECYAKAMEPGITI